RTAEGSNRTVTNNTNPLCFHVVAPVPSRTMHNLSLEAIQALDIRIPWLVQLSHGTNQEITLDCILWTKFRILTTRNGDINFPTGGRVIPCSGFNRGVEPNIFIELVLVGNVAEIVKDFFLARIFARPIGVLLKGVRIKHAPDYLT